MSEMKVSLRQGEDSEDQAPNGERARIDDN